jgi:hypothetical protein
MDGPLPPRAGSSYGSTYESYTILRIKAPKLIARTDLTHDECVKYRQDKFRQFQLR